MESPGNRGATSIRGGGGGGGRHPVARIVVSWDDERAA